MFSQKPRMSVLHTSAINDFALGLECILKSYERPVDRAYFIEVLDASFKIKWMIVISEICTCQTKKA